MSISCRVCGSLRLVENADSGSLFCSVCGSLSQDVSNESVDTDAVRASGHGYRIRIGVADRTTSHADAPAGASEADLTFNATRAFFQCVQTLLMHQAATLVQTFGCSSRLVPTLGRLWIVFLDEWYDQNSDMCVRLSATKVLKHRPRAKAPRTSRANSGLARGSHQLLESGATRESIVVVDDGERDGDGEDADDENDAMQARSSHSQLRVLQLARITAPRFVFRFQV